MRNIFIVLLGLFVGGCTFAQKAIIGQSVDEARAAKDIEADVLSAGLCAMSIGALNRRHGVDAEKLAAVNLLCYGQPPRPAAPSLDAATLQTLRMLLELRRTE